MPAHIMLMSASLVCRFVFPRNTSHECTLLTTLDWKHSLRSLGSIRSSCLPTLTLLDEIHLRDSVFSTGLIYNSNFPPLLRRAQTLGPDHLILLPRPSDPNIGHPRPTWPFIRLSRLPFAPSGPRLPMARSCPDRSLELPSSGKDRHEQSLAVQRSAGGCTYDAIQ